MAVEARDGVLVETKHGVGAGRYPDHREAQLGERAAEAGVGEDALLDHVVLADDDGAHAVAIGRNPEVGARAGIGALGGRGHGDGPG